MKRLYRIALGLACAAPELARAATRPAASLLGIHFDSSSGPGVPMQIIGVLTGLTLLPAVIMSVTPFLRLTVVLHFLRQALGTQSTPSNQVLVGLALFLTLLVMQPVGAEIYQKAWEPLDKGQLTYSQAFDAAAQPLRTFLLRFAHEKDVQLFLEASHRPAPRTPADVDLAVLIPATFFPSSRPAFRLAPCCFCRF
jgi:flagellar biosynthetic protein FliP